MPVEKLLYNEKELLLRIATGDETAFEQLFYHYRPDIYSYVVHIADVASANEVVQDVFLKVWLQRERLPEIQQFNAWLITLAKHRIFDELKRIARESAVRQKFTEFSEESLNDVVTRIDTKENEQLLKELSQSLTPQQREVFRLSREENMSYQEIAAALNISKNTVKAHMVKALDQLRHHLKDNPDFSAILLLISLHRHF